jgi:proteasome alpha subunit
MGQIFTHDSKPLEVEILVAEVGLTAEDDRLFHILYDGTVMDETNFSVLGGDAEAISERMSANFESGCDLSGALKCALAALSGTDRQLSADDLEVAALQRGNGRRCFSRVVDADVTSLLA